MMDPGHPSRTGSPAAEDAGQDDVRQTLGELMPWFATVLLHAGAVLIAILVVWAKMNSEAVIEERVIPAIGPVAKQPALKSFNDKPLTPVDPNVRPTPAAEPKQTPKPDASAKPDVNLIGPVGRSGEFQGQFTGAGSNVGEGTIFVPPGGGPNARSFVFVIDASGSMVHTLPFVVAELKRAIRSMSDAHSFTVLFYQDEKVFEALSPGLKPATEQMKTRVFDWLDRDAMAPSGLSNPVNAIEQGLKYKPQVMFLLSDNITGQGRWELNQRELLGRIKLANTAGTKINTIQFLYPDRLVRHGMQPTMELISTQSGGRYRFVSDKELGL